MQYVCPECRNYLSADEVLYTDCGEVVGCVHCLNRDEAEETHCEFCSKELGSTVYTRVSALTGQAVTVGCPACLREIEAGQYWEEQ